ncbi:hypothetical protein THIOSC15_490008 [uncultured Thiomicrorhabdus sp.]
MKTAATKISYEKLHNALELDESIHIDDIFLNTDDRYTRTFHVVLSGENPYIPEHQEGSQLATNPLYHFQRIQPLYGLGYTGMSGYHRGEGFYEGIRRYL